MCWIGRLAGRLFTAAGGIRTVRTLIVQTAFVNGLALVYFLVVLTGYGSTVRGNLDILFGVAAVLVLALDVGGLAGSRLAHTRPRLGHGLILLAALACPLVVTVAAVWSLVLDPVFLPGLMLYLRFAFPYALEVGVAACLLTMPLFVTAGILTALVDRRLGTDLDQSVVDASTSAHAAML